MIRARRPPGRATRRLERRDRRRRRIRAARRRAAPRLVASSPGGSGTGTTRLARDTAARCRTPSKRISNGALPREGTVPATKERPRLTTWPLSSRPSARIATRSAVELVALRTSPKIEDARASGLLGGVRHAQTRGGLGREGLGFEQGGRPGQQEPERDGEGRGSLVPQGFDGVEPRPPSGRDRSRRRSRRRPRSRRRSGSDCELTSVRHSAK